MIPISSGAGDRHDSAHARQFIRILSSPGKQRKAHSDCKCSLYRCQCGAEFLTICYYQASGKQTPVHILALLDGVVCVAGFTALLIRSLGINSVYVANVLTMMI